MPMISWARRPDRRRGANSRWCNGENSAVQHQHVVTEHHHVSVHGGGIGNPGSTGTFPFIGSPR